MMEQVYDFEAGAIRAAVSLRASPFDRIANQERRAILRECEAAVLTRENVNLLRLRYRNDLSFRQIALVMRSTEDAVAQMHGRTIEKLREQLFLIGIRTKEHI